MQLPSSVPRGPFTWAEFNSLGLQRAQLNDWLDVRLLRRVLRGVYQRCDESDTPISRARGVALVSQPFAVMCDRTAAWLHGVDTFDFRELEILPPIEAWALRHHPKIRRHGCAGGRRDLAAIDVMDLNGVRVTTPLRTALDLGARLRRGDALAALDGFMRVHGLTRDDYLGLLPRYRRRRGVIQLRQLVAIADGRSESPGESSTRLAILDAGYPDPVPQYWVCEGGIPIWRLDLAYPKHKVAIEYDGVAFHDSPEQRRHDEERRAWLRARGWIIIVVRKGDFEQFARESWLRELGEALRIR